ncbi:hypothetical protein Pan44_27270 [Caulifigura coniformis]|uniref:Sulfatase n=1 Tax=Caulifigura coniformis TaxID=2527983 RepID=A0A517SEY1_9PLAN|nr:DUF1501 domain-containing protein [Caulifigura coniformis]QDT54692.1 hypothetical protein Pan44_27270 [Caulifigura coniformis]
MNHRSNTGYPCGRIGRRSFLADVGMGFTGLALGSMLQREARGDSPIGVSGGHFPARAKNVIWVFLSGGVSHLETFDPKPRLNDLAGKTYDETTLPNPQKSPLFLERSRSVVGMDREVVSKIFPLQVGYGKRGESGIEVSDWHPHLAGVVDDLCIVRSMWTTDNDHAAEFQMHTGRHALDEQQPTIGSWVSYGLGSLNDNLPQFVFLGQYKDTRVKKDFAADYLGPQHAGIELSLDPAQPLPFGSRPPGVSLEEQRREFDFINRLNGLSAVEYPDDEQLRARIRSYELAYRMQMSAPEVLNLAAETAETQQMYGIGQPTTELYGRRLLAARRLAERGVRFTLVYLSDFGEWDSHSDIKNLHARSCGRVDQPLAALIRDLKQRGMMDETLVVCATEFGRTPALEATSLNKAGTGRDHHPHGFTIWMAGAGVKAGHVHGATDELGFHAVEHPHYVTDIHATVLHLLGLDNRRLEIPGRKRLEADHGQVIREILT